MVDSEREFVERHLIFMTRAGSHMYGTATAASDIDKRGVCVPPKNVVMGFARNFSQLVYPDEDTTVFGLMKYMQLAAECNPNIIELLFAPDECVEVSHPTWKRLLEHRDKFLSAKAFHTFTGYAFSQLKRIKSHRGWLLNPPRGKPTRADFGLGESGQGIREISRGVDAGMVAPEVIQVIEKERRYKAASDEWTHYETWKKNRNPARAALEAEHGFDTKHAAHLFRLLRMGKEILTEAKVVVRRPDAAELLAIRHGSKSYDQMMAEVEALNAELTDIYEKKSFVVPYAVDREAISDLAVELHEFHWSLSG